MNVAGSAVTSELNHVCPCFNRYAVATHSCASFSIGVSRAISAAGLVTNIVPVSNNKSTENSHMPYLAPMPR